MSSMSFIAAHWQRALPLLGAIGLVLWTALFRHDPLNARALFAALLVIYFFHQIEEHLWPGGFRQFVDAHVFRSGCDDWPVDRGGVALINIGYVWLPVGLAALFPEALRWLGFAWVGLTLVNGLIHVVTTIVLRIYNPGLVTGLALLIPFTVFVLVHERTRGVLSGAEIGLVVLLGIVLHLPLGAAFVIQFLRRRRTKA